jgi:hypothetical protein
MLLLYPLPRPPEPHENVGHDCDDEKRPGTGDDELVESPIGVIEKVSIHIGYAIVPDL